MHGCIVGSCVYVSDTYQQHTCICIGIHSIHTHTYVKRMHTYAYIHTQIHAHTKHTYTYAHTGTKHFHTTRGRWPSSGWRGHPPRRGWHATRWRGETVARWRRHSGRRHARRRGPGMAWVPRRVRVCVLHHGMRVYIMVCICACV